MPVGPNGLQNTADYSGVIERMTNRHGRINRSGLFEFEGKSSRTVIIDREGDTLKLLPEKQWGAPASQGETGPSESEPFLISHIPHEDFVYPDDVSDRRRPGSTEPDSLTRRITKKLREMRDKHELTHEWMKMSALKGILRGGSGKVIYDLYSKFGITQNPTVFFDLDNVGSNVKSKCLQVKRLIEDGVENGGVVGDITVYVSSEFFDKLTSHNKVVDAYNHFEATNQAAVNAASQIAAQKAGLQPNRDDLRLGFSYGGLTFQEYNATAKDHSGNPAKFIDDGMAHAFPLNIPGMYKHFGAPANRNGYVNTEGIPYYAWTYEDPEGRFTKVTSQSNPLFLVTRPQALVTLSAAAS